MGRLFCIRFALGRYITRDSVKLLKVRGLIMIRQNIIGRQEKTVITSFKIAEAQKFKNPTLVPIFSEMALRTGYRLLLLIIGEISDIGWSSVPFLGVLSIIADR